MKYYINKKTKYSFTEAISKVTESLEKEGFGVLTEINLQEKFKEKLNVNFRKYLILGACNPLYAFKAISVEDRIGAMLPCNIIIQELEKGIIEIAAVDPMASMVSIDNDSLIEIAFEVKEKLTRVIDSL